MHIRHGVEFDELLHRYRPPHAASVSVATLPRFRAPNLQEHGTVANRVRIAPYVAESKDWRSCLVHDRHNVASQPKRHQNVLKHPQPALLWLEQVHQLAWTFDLAWIF